jgi:hypothetical protein
METAVAALRTRQVADRVCVVMAAAMRADNGAVNTASALIAHTHDSCTAALAPQSRWFVQQDVAHRSMLLVCIISTIGSQSELHTLALVTVCAVRSPPLLPPSDVNGVATRRLPSPHF